MFQRSILRFSKNNVYEQVYKITQKFRLVTWVTTPLVLLNLTSITGEHAAFKFTLKIDIPGSSETLLKGQYGLITQMITVEIFTQQQAQISGIE
jgi:hypothetical protein